MKKILLVVGGVITVIFNAVAENQRTLTKEEINNRSREILAKAGIPLLESSEVSIFSAKKFISDANIQSSKNDKYIAKKMQEYMVMHDEQLKNGFVKTDEPRAKELMELKHIAPYQQKKYKDVLSFESTHLRSSKDELKLAYTFMGVPEAEIDHNIGIAPYGAYKEIKNGDDGDGWDGAVQFFDKNSIGSCAYTEHNRRLAHSGVELIKELVTYEVHNKPTIALIKGTKKTGFVYKVEWYDTTFTRELECGNVEFSPKLRAEVVELANRIDDYQQSN